MLEPNPLSLILLYKFFVVTKTHKTTLSRLIPVQVKIIQVNVTKLHNKKMYVTTAIPYETHLLPNYINVSAVSRPTFRVNKTRTST